MVINNLKKTMELGPLHKYLDQAVSAIEVLSLHVESKPMETFCLFCGDV